jgi:hypothetical protein
MTLYKRVRLEEGTPVQFVGTYILRQGQPPDTGFVEVGEDEYSERITALEAENARLRQTLKGIWDMAEEDIREGTEGTYTSQIEADARAVLKEVK